MAAGSIGGEAGRRAEDQCSLVYGASASQGYGERKGLKTKTSKSLRFFGDALCFLKLILCSAMKDQELKDLDRYFFFLSRTLSSWADGMNALQLYFFFFFFNANQSSLDNMKY